MTSGSAIESATAKEAIRIIAGRLSPDTLLRAIHDMDEVSQDDVLGPESDEIAAYAREKFALVLECITGYKI